MPALIWVLMVTSAANRGWPGDVAVSDLLAAGLPAPSLVRSAKIATIDAQQAERIGRLPRPDQDWVAQQLHEILAETLASG